MKELLHNGTITITDEGINNEWITPLIEKCLHFYPRAAKNISVIMVKNKRSREGNIGLAIEDIDGFVLYWQNMVDIAGKYAKDGVNVNATIAYLIVDTCFHEMHHCESYKEDYAWTISHRDEEEANANAVAADLCVEFFKTTIIDVPIGNTPYWYKTQQNIITNLREYFNILLDSKNEWPAEVNVKTPPLSPVPTPTTPHTLSEDVIDPLANITLSSNTVLPTNCKVETTAQKAQELYHACFDKIFSGCCPTANGFDSPEKILEPITTREVVGATMMDSDGIVREQNIQRGQLSGIILKNKMPAYNFTLADGKQRWIIPQNPQETNEKGEFSALSLRAQKGEKIGYIIDIINNKSLLRYENGKLFAA